MIVKVSKWGNSLGVRLPRGIAEELRVSDGALVDVSVENGRIVAVPVLPALTLDALLGGVTRKNLHRPLLDDAPRGGEAW